MKWPGICRDNSTIAGVYVDTGGDGIGVKRVGGGGGAGVIGISGNGPGYGVLGGGIGGPGVEGTGSHAAPDRRNRQVPNVAGSSFTIHLSKAVSATTKAAWFVVN